MGQDLTLSPPLVSMLVIFARKNNSICYAVPLIFFFGADKSVGEFSSRILVQKLTFFFGNSRADSSRMMKNCYSW